MNKNEPRGLSALPQGFKHDHYNQTSSSLNRLANQCQILCGAFLGRENKGQGSGKVKFGLVAEIYEFSVCFRIIYLMVKNVFFICLTLKLCDLGGDKQGYPQRHCNVH